MKKSLGKKKLLVTLTIIVQKCAASLGDDSDDREIDDGSRSLRRLLRDPVYHFSLRRVGVAEVVRQNKLEKLFFLYPDILLNSDKLKEDLESSMIVAMDKIGLSDTGDKLRAFVSAAVENVAMVNYKHDVAQGDGVIKLANVLESWLPGQDVSHIFVAHLRIGFSRLRNHERCFLSYRKLNGWDVLRRFGV